MFGVLLFLCTPCLFVCIDTSSSEVTRNTKTNLVEYLESQVTESCALDFSSLPNNVLFNHCDMPRLI
jgi:hypothetical protein